MNKSRSKNQISQTAKGKRDDLRRSQASTEQVAREADRLSEAASKVDLTLIVEAHEQIEESKAEIADRSSEIVEVRVDEQTESSREVTGDITENREVKDEAARQAKKSESIRSLSDKGRSVTTDAISDELRASEALLANEIQDSKRSESAAARSLQATRSLMTNSANRLKKR